MRQSLAKQKSATAAASITNPSSLHTVPIPLGKYNGWPDLCDSTYISKGNNILGLDVHYIQASPIGNGDSTCYPAVITSVLETGCSGAQSTGIKVNLSWTNNKGQVKSEGGILYQGYPSKEDKQSGLNRWLYANWHIKSHDINLAPPPGYVLDYSIPPGSIMEDNRGNQSPAPDAPPSPTFTGCRGISATGLSGGAVTWICWCNGKETYRQVTPPNGNLDGVAITNAHGTCQDDNLPVPPVTDQFQKSVVSRAFAQDFGEQAGLISGHLPFPYVSVRAQIACDRYVQGITNVRTGSSIYSPYFGSTTQYIWRYVSINLQGPANTGTWDTFFGYYFTENNQISYIAGLTAGGVKTILWTKLATQSATNVGPQNHTFQISWDGYQLSSPSQARVTYNYVLDNQVVYTHTIVGMSENSGGSVQVGMETKHTSVATYVAPAAAYNQLVYQTKFGDFLNWDPHFTLVPYRATSASKGTCLTHPADNIYYMGEEDCPS